MQSAIPVLLYAHSVVRYIILLLAAVVAFGSLMGMLGKKPFSNKFRIWALLLLIFCDLQLLMGLLLYHSKIIQTGILTGGRLMKDTYSRFFGVEHAVSMLIAIVLVHVGYRVTKRNMDNDRKYKNLFWCSFIALAIFMAMTPWAAKQVVGRPNIPVMPA